MSTVRAPNKLDIPLPLAEALVAEQFPAWAHLPVHPVEKGGWDNQTFRLGANMSLRFPTAEGYAGQVQKEHLWLPVLAARISVQIPTSLTMGHPSEKYPWHWSVYRWIDGESANLLSLEGGILQAIASGLAQFLNELHQIDTIGGPAAGLQNYYRGGMLSVYDGEARAAIVQLQDWLDVEAATALWDKAISSHWCQRPVWVHGDLSAGNLLLQGGRLVAVIDFGCMGVGDPACDLVIAWTLLTDESRAVFKSHVSLDPDTWARARGWALWKALITWAAMDDKACVNAMKQRHVIEIILREHALENAS